MMIDIQRMLLLLLCGSIASSEAFRAYDCKSRQTKTMALDLTEPGPCPDPTTDFEEPVKESFQLIQTNVDEDLVGYQCLVVATKEATVCGTWSRPSAQYGTKRSQWEQLEPVSAEECRRAVDNKILWTMDRRYKIKLGETQTDVFFSHGSWDHATGECTTKDSFTTNNVHYRDAYEEVFLKILVRKIHGAREQHTDTANFYNGVEVKTKFSEGTHWDDHKGRIIWNNEESQNCTNYLSGLYVGAGTVHKRKGQPNRVDSIVMTNRNRTAGQHLGLVLGVPRRICGKLCHEVTSLRGFVTCFFRDDRPQLPEVTYRFSQSSDQALNEAEHHVERDFLSIGVHLEMHSGFAALSRQTCANRRKILFNKLQAISGAKNPHALLDIYGVGHQVVTAGSATAYVIQCEPVEVQAKSINNCTNEVPVVKNYFNSVRHNESLDADHPAQQGAEQEVLFMDPLTFILKKFPTVVPCSTSMPVRWKLNGEWYCSGPTGPYRCSEPVQLDVKFHPYHASAAFLHGLKGDGLLTDEMKEARDIYLDTVTHDEATLTRNSFAMIGNARGHLLGSTLSIQDLYGTTEFMISQITPSFMFWVFGAYTPHLLGMFTFGSMMMGLGLAMYRFVKEFFDHGWDGGRTVLRALLAVVGVALSPVIFLGKASLEMQNTGQEMIGHYLPAAMAGQREPDPAPSAPMLEPNQRRSSRASQNQSGSDSDDRKTPLTKKTKKTKRSPAVPTPPPAYESGSEPARSVDRARQRR